MGVLVKTSLFICILWGIHIWIKQVIDTEEKCQEYNIQIKINLAIKESEIFDKLNIEKVDLSGLLQNLLDNAIEECCRISEDFERKILWTMNTTEYGVKIRVENTCCNIKNIDFITKKEDKNAHGWGVRIIKEVVQKAGGNINYTKEEGDNICAEVFLPFIGNF